MKTVELKAKWYILAGTGYQGQLRRAFIYNSKESLFNVRAFGAINLN